ncbi:hypothetical protein P153DRAFT_309696 [Dothidotthia symphoricarpi CBS 119687]|uniref:Uncharacterized protein n=1 Tax=Dothidotthia symphoricarpi CBS 119687 TaxID=1392245 RepID=A0A6A6AP39_9PLEO|nr:uncharacterized protein P153DRAFT_309696 [Dothidotthia symphoricarpi CBS 119687]KAF2132908.1 hypothetical protein P153DRAFT_309696 [Dothidotthia symphoricarpi CBS 119687]
MSDPDPPAKPYRRRYLDALKDFENGDMEKCIVVTKFNLSDITLPPYYVIKNCILLASALDNWDDADVWRLAAEQAYITSFREANRKQDTNSLETLQDLRAELDTLNKFRQEDMAILVDDETSNSDMSGEEDEDEDEDEDKDEGAAELEDGASLAVAKDEDELASR